MWWIGGGGIRFLHSVTLSEYRFIIQSQLVVVAVLLELCAFSVPRPVSWVQGGPTTAGAVRMPAQTFRYLPTLILFFSFACSLLSRGGQTTPFTFPFTWRMKNMLRSSFSPF